VKIIRLMREEIKKMYSNPAFFVVIFAVMLIYMTGVVYIEPVTEKSYNLLNISNMENYREVLAGSWVSTEMMIIRGPNSYIWMFAPILASVPFVALLCGAKKNNNIRFEIMRVGKRSYIVGKLLAAMITGGTAFLIGYIGYAIACYFILIPIGERGLFDISMNSNLNRLYEIGGVSLIIVLRFACIFIYGMTATVLPFAISSLIRNKYLVICVPFMLSYFIEVFLNKPIDIIMELSRTFSASQPADMIRFDLEQNLKIILYWLVCMLIAMILHYVVLNKQCDCGE
jgi:hypothetical protein